MMKKANVESRHSQLKRKLERIGTQSRPSILNDRRSYDFSGMQSIIMAFNVPGNVPDVLHIDLTFLKISPSLAIPFMDALREWAIGKTPHSIKELSSSLRRGFFRYIEERARKNLSCSDITTSLINEFVSWLNQIDESGTARFKVATRKSYLSVFRRLVELLQKAEKWKACFVSPAHFKEYQWPGSHRQALPTAVIHIDDFRKIYLSCVREVGEIMSAVEEGRKYLDEISPNTSALGHRKRVYERDWRLLLAALSELYPGVIPSRAELIKRDPQVGRATNGPPGSKTFIELQQYLYPSPRLLIPFVLLFGIHFAYNAYNLLTCDLDDFEIKDEFGAQRIVGSSYKGRSSRNQFRSIPATTDIDNPAVMLNFIKNWTKRIRQYAPPHMQGRLFLYVAVAGNKKEVTAFGGRTTLDLSSTTISSPLAVFCKKHGISQFSLKQIRSTVIDLGHEIFNGDLLALTAIGGQRKSQTIYSHYTSDGAKQRNVERLSGIMLLREREVESLGKISARSRHPDDDQGAATPGWRCLDPFSSPIQTQKVGKLCSAYGRCPICPMAHVRFTSAEVCARVYELKVLIEEARHELEPKYWTKSWAPVLEKLNSFWLAQFSDETFSKARELRLPKLPKVE